MKREIKFRAWEKESKLMRFWNFLITADVDRFAKEEWCLEELSQFTGLKDKNGKEIYEGDILQSSKGNLIGEVSINPKGAWVEWRYKNPSEEQRKDVFVSGRIADERFSSERGWYFEVLGEVIGDIYENPELLDNK